MHSKSLSEKTARKPGKSDPALLAETEFPNVRYFQIHFEFLQEQLRQTQDALHTLQMQMRQLEQRLPVRHLLSGHTGLEGIPTASTQEFDPQPRRR